MLLIIVLGAGAALGWKAKERVIETEQLRIVDNQGRLRFTLDSVLTSYDSTGQVRGTYR
jgi:hypothetical protein